MYNTQNVNAMRKGIIMMLLTEMAFSILLLTCCTRESVTPEPEPQPAEEPQPTSFCGGVGTEGCNAISCTDSSIVGWAVTCTVVRGPVDIANPDGPKVRYGDESMAIGPATTNTQRAVSLGDGGTATLTFEYPIRNGEGPDFAVFENPFQADNADTFPWRG